jgi:hypothetical protein
MSVSKYLNLARRTKNSKNSLLIRPDLFLIVPKRWLLAETKRRSILASLSLSSMSLDYKQNSLRVSGVMKGKEPWIKPM